MKIAVLGAGFCGLAVCWHLLQQKNVQITLFDPCGIGGGASGMAAGLLHPFAGLHAKLNWQGRDGLNATKMLLAKAEEALDKKVADYSGILRPAITQEQIQDYQLCASKHKDVQWLEASECQKRIPGLPPYPGLFIPSGITVDCKAYMAGLWRICRRSGVTLERTAITEQSKLQGYDYIIACLGSATPSFKELQHLQLSIVKGQIVELAWPENLPLLAHTLNSQVYLAMGKQSCYLGSTFERGFKSDMPFPTDAYALMKAKAEELFPPLNNPTIIDGKAGFRASTPNQLPYLLKVNEKLFCITGMASKGLLWHALMAEKLMEQLF